MYLNIGTNYEQWITLQNTVIGMRPQQSFTLANVQKHSIYWYATELRVAGAARLLPQGHAADAAPGRGRRRRAFLPERGRRPVRRCPRKRSAAASTSTSWRPAARSSRATASSATRASSRRSAWRTCSVVEKTGEFWDHDPGRWLSEPDVHTWADEEIEKPAFWKNNYLSTDYRIPINLVRTNACRAMATNAMNGHMWYDFASDSYQQLPSVGAIPFFNPYLGETAATIASSRAHAAARRRAGGGGGPGFYRVPTLISIWTTAPLLHNNSLGMFNNDPSVDGRLLAFDDAIRKLLWPERRLQSTSYNGATADRLKADHGLIWRTPEESYLTLPAPTSRASSARSRRRCRY